MGETAGTKTLAAPYLLFGAPPGGLAVVSDPSGAMWNIRDILGASALVSIFTMGAFTVFAWIRLAEQHKETASQ
jgi:hypothetical protein